MLCHERHGFTGVALHATHIELRLTHDVEQSVHTADGYAYVVTGAPDYSWTNEDLVGVESVVGLGHLLARERDSGHTRHLHGVRAE